MHAILRWGEKKVLTETFTTGPVNCLFTPDRASVTEAVLSLPLWSSDFLGASYRNMDDSKCSCTTDTHPPPTPPPEECWLTKALSPGAFFSTCRQLHLTDNLFTPAIVYFFSNLWEGPCKPYSFLSFQKLVFYLVLSCWDPPSSLQECMFWFWGDSYITLKDAIYLLHSHCFSK